MARQSTKPSMALALYRMLLWLATPFIFARLWWRGRREPGYRQRMAERFGAIDATGLDGVIWFHAVSAGEVIAAAPLVRRLAAHYPERGLLLTTMTPTGAEQAAALLGDVVTHRYAPYDMTFAVQRFLQRLRPSVLILLETELWPNLIHLTAARSIPIYLLNARLSARSAKGYGRIAALSKPMLANLTHISCQYPDHAQRFQALGVAAPRISVAGNLKFDRSVPADLTQRCDELAHACLIENRLIWLAASTHDGEESLLLDSFQRLREQQPSLQLILAPRHPHRVADVEALLKPLEYRSARLSEILKAPLQDSVDVILVDQMGMLLPLYDLADVAFVGGSLIEFGGQNPIEPALVGTPVISGPHCFNFTEVVEKLVAVGAMYQVSTVQELVSTLLELLNDPQLRARSGGAGRAETEANRGASEKVAQQLIQLIGDTAH